MPKVAKVITANRQIAGGDARNRRPFGVASWTAARRRATKTTASAMRPKRRLSSATSGPALEPHKATVVRVPGRKQDRVSIGNTIGRVSSWKRTSAEASFAGIPLTVFAIEECEVKNISARIGANAAASGGEHAHGSGLIEGHENVEHLAIGRHPVCKQRSARAQRNEHSGTHARTQDVASGIPAGEHRAAVCARREIVRYRAEQPDQRQREDRDDREQIQRREPATRMAVSSLSWLSRPSVNTIASSNVSRITTGMFATTINMSTFNTRCVAISCSRGTTQDGRQLAHGQDQHETRKERQPGLRQRAQQVALQDPGSH